VLTNPKWRLIPENRAINTDMEMVDEEEDISDANVEAMHDAHLRQMKEKMELYQALKKEHGRGTPTATPTGGRGNR
jgi:hypothetical protein